jgi:hypothetical protein
VPRVLPTLHGLSSELKTLTERLVIGNRSEDCVWYDPLVLVASERREMQQRIKRTYSFDVTINVDPAFTDQNLKPEQPGFLSSVLTLVEQVTSKRPICGIERLSVRSKIPVLVEKT